MKDSQNKKYCDNFPSATDSTYMHKNTYFIKNTIKEQFDQVTHYLIFMHLFEKIFAYLDKALRSGCLEVVSTKMSLKKGMQLRNTDLLPFIPLKTFVRK